MTDTFIVTVTAPTEGEGLFTFLTPTGRMQTRPILPVTIEMTADWQAFVETVIQRHFPGRKGLHGSREIYSSHQHSSAFVAVYEVDFDALPTVNLKKD